MSELIKEERKTNLHSYGQAERGEERRREREREYSVFYVYLCSCIILCVILLVTFMQTSVIHRTIKILNSETKRYRLVSPRQRKRLKDSLVSY